MTGPLRIDTPGQLRDVMRLDFTYSDAQFAAITAPLSPAIARSVPTLASTALLSS